MIGPRSMKFESKYVAPKTFLRSVEEGKAINSSSFSSRVDEISSTSNNSDVNMMGGFGPHNKIVSIKSFCPASRYPECLSPVGCYGDKDRVRTPSTSPDSLRIKAKSKVDMVKLQRMIPKNLNEPSSFLNCEEGIIQEFIRYNIDSPSKRSISSSNRRTLKQVR